MVAVIVKAMAVDGAVSLLHVRRRARSTRRTFRLHRSPANTSPPACCPHWMPPTCFGRQRLLGHHCIVLSERADLDALVLAMGQRPLEGGGSRAMWLGFRMDVSGCGRLRVAANSGR